MGRKKQPDHPAEVGSPSSTSVREGKDRRVPVQTIARAASSRDTRTTLADAAEPSKGSASAHENLSLSASAAKYSASSSALSPNMTTTTAPNSSLCDSTGGPSTGTTVDARTSPHQPRPVVAPARAGTPAIKMVPVKTSRRAAHTRHAALTSNTASARAEYSRPTATAQRAATPSSLGSPQSPLASASTSTASPSPSPSPRHDPRARARGVVTAQTGSPGSRSKDSSSQSTSASGMTSTKPAPTFSSTLNATAGAATTTGTANTSSLTVFKQPPPPPAPILRVAVEKEQELSVASGADDIGYASDCGSDAGSTVSKPVLHAEHVYLPIFIQHTAGSPRQTSIESPAQLGSLSLPAGGVSSHSSGQPPHEDGAFTEVRFTATKKPPPQCVSQRLSARLTRSAKQVATTHAASSATTFPTTENVTGQTHAEAASTSALRPASALSRGTTNGGGVSGVDGARDPGQTTPTGRTRRRTSIVSVHPPSLVDRPLSLSHIGSVGVSGVGASSFSSLPASTSPPPDTTMALHDNSSRQLSRSTQVGISPEATNALSGPAGARPPSSPAPILSTGTATATTAEGIPVVPSLQSGFRHLRQSFQSADVGLNSASCSDLRTPTYATSAAPGGFQRSARSARSAHSMRSGRIHRTSSTIAPLSLQQLFADTPEDFILPRGRFSLSAENQQRVLGRGAYGEVIQGELYPPSVDSGRLYASGDGPDSGAASKIHSPFLLHTSGTPADFNSTSSLVLLPSQAGGPSSSTHPTPRTNLVHMQPYTQHTASFYSETKLNVNDSQSDSVDIALHPLRGTQSQRGTRVPTDYYGRHNSISFDGEHSAYPKVSPHQLRVNASYEGQLNRFHSAQTAGAAPNTPRHLASASTTVATTPHSTGGHVKDSASSYGADAAVSSRSPVMATCTSSTASSSSFAHFATGSKSEPFNDLADPYPSPDEHTLLAPLHSRHGGGLATFHGRPHDPKRPTMVPAQTSAHHSPCDSSSAHLPRSAQDSLSSAPHDAAHFKFVKGQSSADDDADSIMRTSSHPLRDGSVSHGESTQRGSPRQQGRNAPAAALAAVTVPPSTGHGRGHGDTHNKNIFFPAVLPTTTMTAATGVNQQRHRYRHADPRTSASSFSLLPVTETTTTGSLISSTPGDDSSSRTTSKHTTHLPREDRNAGESAMTVGAFSGTSAAATSATMTKPLPARVSSDATASLVSAGSTASEIDMCAADGAPSNASRATDAARPHHRHRDSSNAGGEHDEEEDTTAPWSTGEATPLRVAGHFSFANSTLIDTQDQSKRSGLVTTVCSPVKGHLTVVDSAGREDGLFPSSPLELAHTTHQAFPPHPPSAQRSQTFIRAEHKLSSTLPPLSVTSLSGSPIRALGLTKDVVATATTSTAVHAEMEGEHEEGTDTTSGAAPALKSAQSQSATATAAFYEAIAQHARPHALLRSDDDDDDDDENDQRQDISDGHAEQSAGGGESPAAPKSPGSTPAVFSFNSFGTIEDQMRLSAGDLPRRSSSSSQALASPVAVTSAKPLQTVPPMETPSTAHRSPTGAVPSSARNAAALTTADTSPPTGAGGGEESRGRGTYGKSLLTTTSGGATGAGDRMTLTSLTIPLDTTTTTDVNGGTLCSTVSSLMPEGTAPALPTHPSIDAGTSTTLTSMLMFGTRRSPTRPIDSPTLTIGTPAAIATAACSGPQRPDEDEHSVQWPRSAPNAHRDHLELNHAAHARAHSQHPLGIAHARTVSSRVNSARDDIDAGGDFMPLDATTSSLGEAVARGTIPFRPVAVKVVAKADLSRPNFFQAFRNEMLMSSQLHHACLVNVFGLSEDNNNIYFVMDLAEKGNLSDYLRTFGVADTRMMAPSFMADLVLALEYLRDGRQHPYKRPLPLPQQSSAMTPHSSRDRRLSRGFISCPPPSVESASLGATLVLSDDADTPTPTTLLTTAAAGGSGGAEKQQSTPPLASVPSLADPTGTAATPAAVNTDDTSRPEGTARSNHSATSGATTARLFGSLSGSGSHPRLAHPPPLRHSGKEDAQNHTADNENGNTGDGEEENDTESGFDAHPLSAQLLAESVVVHRDVKPDNMLMTWDYHIKLGDFGNACFLGDEEANRYGGTPAYMAPEAVRQSAAGPYSDLWALGCTLYELLEGERLFQGKTDYLVLEKVKKFDPDALIFPSDTIATHSKCAGSADVEAGHAVPAARERPSDADNLLASLHNLSSAESRRSPSSDFLGSEASSSGRRAEQADAEVHLHAIMEHGKDLVRQLVRPSPTERLGSDERGGFEALKKHPFFQSIDWAHVVDMPNITTRNTNYTEELSEFILEEEKLVYCAPVVQVGPGEAAMRPSSPSSGVPTSTAAQPQRTKARGSLNSTTTIASPTADTPAMSGVLQLLALTEGPSECRLFVVDPESETITTTFPWSPAVRVNVINSSIFQVVFRPIGWPGGVSSVSGSCGSGRTIRQLNSLPPTGGAPSTEASSSPATQAASSIPLGPSQSLTFRDTNGRADLWGVKVNRCVEKAFGYHHTSSSAAHHRHGSSAGSKFNGGMGGGGATAHSFSSASHPPTLNFSPLTSSRSSQQTLLSRMRNTPRLSAQCEAGSLRPGSGPSTAHSQGHHTSPHTSSITVTVASTSREARLPSVPTTVVPSGTPSTAARDHDTSS